VKKSLLFVCLSALCNLALFAQTEGHPRMVHSAQKSATHVAPQEAPAGLKKIYSNLGKSKTNLYDDTNAYAVPVRQIRDRHRARQQRSRYAARIVIDAEIHLVRSAAVILHSNLHLRDMGVGFRGKGHSEELLAVAGVRSLTPR
jgi:hypothetical protein